MIITSMTLHIKKFMSRYSYVTVSKMVSQESIGNLASFPASGFITNSAISFSAATGPMLTGGSASIPSVYGIIVKLIS